MNRKIFTLAALVVIGALIVPAVSWAAVGKGTSKALNQSLFFAVGRGDVDWLAVLRDKGGDMDVTLNTAGLDPVETFGQERIAEVLATDADIENWTLLFWAVYFEDRDTVRVLLKSGAHVNAADLKGSMPLHWAAWTGNYPIVKLLLENDANPYVLDRLGRSPLDWALMTGQVDVIRILPPFPVTDQPDCDGDGIADHADKCPCTPKGATVDDRGCWMGAYAEFFDFNKSVVKKKYLPHLKRQAEIMAANPQVAVEVAGHTDSVGSDRYNLALGMRRAKAVKKVLVRYGVNPSRLAPKSYGESQPIADNATPAGRAKNRRVELRMNEMSCECSN